MKKIRSISFLIILLCHTLVAFCQIQTKDIKPYKEIITSEAISKKGFISTHFLNNKVYLEIPETVLNKDLLFVNHQIIGWPHENLIRFINKNNEIELIIPEIDSKAGNTIPLMDDIFNIKIRPISFPILATNLNSSSYVIDATIIFLNTPKGLFGGGEPIISDATYIDEVRTCPNVIEVKTTKTVPSKVGPMSSDAYFSLMLLPEPMMPRLYDHRMGYFNESLEINLFNDPIKSSVERWRLEKKNPNISLSEPVKPIVFYFDPETPNRWKAYIRAGIYEWLPAFEAAGFKNAIIVKDAPINDKDWSMKSVRYSVIRWSNKSKYRGFEGVGGGTANKIIDRRSGEILKGDIIIGNINDLVDYYFVRCSPLDKRAQQYPFTDDLMGELIQSLTAHETGHVFGLQDGNYGEYTYPFEKMRNEKWLQEMGHSPSVMNYARQNFIVQPEDYIDPSLLIQKVGPTDIYNIRWAYTQFKNINIPDDELPYLEKIIMEQDTIPWYRINMGAHDVGPGSTNEVVESDNPVKATELGLKNIKRVINLIPNVTLNERGNKIEKRFYLKTLELWVDQMKSVASLVGGYTIQYKSSSQDGLVYTPIPANRQKEAVSFLNKKAFNPPLWMVRPDITGRFIVNHDYNIADESDIINSSINIISRRQIRILSELLSSKKLRGLEESSINGENTYEITDLLKDLRKGLWGEMKGKTIRINPYRQEIQIAYIAFLKEIIERKNQNFQGQQTYFAYNKYFYSNYTRGIIYEELNSLKKLIEQKLDQIKDNSTKGHLKLCLLEIDKTQS